MIAKHGLLFGGGGDMRDIDSAGAACGMASSMLDLPPNVLDQIVRLLPGNERKPLRTSCRELRCLANEATHLLSVDVSDAAQWKR